MPRWERNTFVDDILAYIYAEVALRLGDSELNTFIKDILAFI
jgi:uncharacterized protein YyaL (SSP411 family)